MIKSFIISNIFVLFVVLLLLCQSIVNAIQCKYTLSIYFVLAAAINFIVLFV